MLKPPTPAQERVLREQQITATEPGTILHDFAAFLDFIAAAPVVTGGKHHLLPIASLTALNARMRQPIEVRLKRPMQKSYPHLNGLYLLARATGLLRLEQHAKKAALTLDGQAMTAWMALNDTEHYFALVEAYLLRASLEMIGERRMGWLTGLWSDCRLVQERIPDKGLQIAGTRLYESSVSYWGLHNIALMEMFGWLRVKRDQPQPDKGWMIAAIHRTAFGNALLHLLMQTFSIETLLLKKEAEEEQGVPGDVVFDAYQELLQPYFPAWQRSLTLTAENKFREGVFVFKVSLGKPWRRIAIPAQLTLDDLSYAILKAFDFDDDHLHCFEYKNRFGLTTRVNHPYMDEPPFTAEVRIGDVPLTPGTAMEYTFDFGDNWEFEVLLEEIRPPNQEMRAPAVLAAHGQAPQQYPNWDEEAEDD